MTEIRTYEDNLQAIEESNVITKSYRSVDGVEEEREETVTRQYIEGYALKFNTKSQPMGGYREVISPDVAKDGVLARSTVIATYNHGKSGSLPFARWEGGKGDLHLQFDEVGLKFRFEVDEDSEALYRAIRKGRVNKCSFAFSFARDENGRMSGIEWTKDGDEPILVIRKFDRLYDVSPVDHPAYQATDLKAREEQSEEQKEEKIVNNKVKFKFAN